MNEFLVYKILKKLDTGKCRCAHRTNKLLPQVVQEVIFSTALSIIKANFSTISIVFTILKW